MDIPILTALIAQRIDIHKFHVRTADDILWPNAENNTPENRAIVADVIANYNSLASEYEATLVVARKRQAYKLESDPIYLEWQALQAAGHEDAEAKRLEWVAKRAAIKGKI